MHPSEKMVRLSKSGVNRQIELDEPMADVLNPRPVAVTFGAQFDPDAEGAVTPALVTAGPYGEGARAIEGGEDATGHRGEFLLVLGCGGRGHWRPC